MQESITSQWKLDPDAVRRRAQSIAGCREVHSHATSGVQPPPHVVTFLVGLREIRDVNQLARVTVFADTGTIGVCRVLRGEVRQIFRRNVISLDVVERYLRQPPKLTTIDHKLVGLGDDRKQPTLRSEIELAEVGVAILGAEKEKLESHLASIQPKKPEATPEKTASKQDNSRDFDVDHSLASSAQQGMEFQFSLSPTAMKHVDQCLTDINKMGKLIKGVSTNGKGTVFLYGNGGVAYTPNIPRPLHQKLSQLRNSTIASRPAYVALGTRDRFFVAFHDGTYHFKGPKGLDRELKHEKRPPLSVAFGNTWDTFFIVFHDGSWKYQGRGIPDALEEKLAARSDRPDLVCVNLGPNGEWFLKARNGRMWWGGVTDETDNAILDLLDAGHELSVIDFGEDGSYFVSYD